MKKYAIFFVAMLIGCGGGGSSGGGDNNAVLYWIPPSQWSDNSVLDPYRDIDRYDIYLSDGSGFTDNDCVASVAGVVDGELVTSFKLGNIVDPNGFVIAMKSVATNGEQSEFSEETYWVSQEDL